MALQYRTPAENVLNRLTSEEQSRITTPTVHNFANLESNNSKLFNYAMSDKQKEKLTSVGIYLSPFSYQPHSHPVCKTLENHLLFNVLVSKLDPEFLLVGIKNSKISFLKQRNRNLDLISYVNRVVTSLDKHRYSNEAVIYNSKAYEIIGEKNSRLPEHIKSILPVQVVEKKRKFFLHDELHYWAISDMVSFASATKFTCLYASLVFPPEILAGATTSLNPWCYEFEVVDDELHFYPDGSRQEGYVQPIDSGQWLLLNQFTDNDGDFYAVDLVYSAYSHHLICITRGQAKVQRTRAFSHFSATTSKPLSKLAGSIRDAIPIEFGVVSKLYRYLRTLKKPDEQSAMAKLSQIVPEPTAFEIKFVEEFSKLVIANANFSSLIMPSVLDQFKRMFLGVLPKTWARCFKLFQRMTLDDFISNLEPFHFRVIAGGPSSLQSIKSLLIDLLDPEIPNDVVCLLDQFQNGMWSLADRAEAPYGSVLCAPFTPYESRRLVLATFELIFHALDGQHLSYQTVLHEMLSYSRLRGKLMQFCYLHSGVLQLELKALHASLVRQASFKVTIFDVGHFWFQASNRKNVLSLSWNEASELNVNSVTGWAMVCKTISSLDLQEHLRCTPVFSRVNGRLIELLKRQAEQPKRIMAALNEGNEVSDCEDEHESQPFSPKVVYESEGEFEVEGDESFVQLVSKDLDTYRISIPETNLTELLEVMRESNQIGLKGRVAAFFSRCECLQYGHNKINYPNNSWPNVLNRFLPDHLASYNTCLAQVYELGAGIGAHADDEKVYGDDQILTINLTGDALITFSDKHKGTMRAMELKIRGGDCFVMKAGFQSKYRHAVKSLSAGRTSLTFRLQRYKKDGGPIVHNCVRADLFNEVFGCEVYFSTEMQASHFRKLKLSHAQNGNGLLQSLAAYIDSGEDDLLRRLDNWAWKLASKEDFEFISRTINLSKNWAPRDLIRIFCRFQCCKVTVIDADREESYTFDPKREESDQFFLLYSSGYYSPCLPKNGCVLKAIAEATRRPEISILRILGRPANRWVLGRMSAGEGLEINMLEAVFEIFGLGGSISTPDGSFIVNESAPLKASFNLEDDHLLFVPSARGDHHIANKVDLQADTKLGLAILRASANTITYLPDLGRAKTLESSLLKGFTGVISDEVFAQQQPWLNSAVVLPHPIGVVLGTAGSGKSRLYTTAVLADPGSSYVFVSPRKMLAGALLADICKRSEQGKPKQTTICTFETFLKMFHKLRGSTVILDEIQLFPPGYVDLILAAGLLKDGNSLFLVGDPCQSTYDNKRDRLELGALKPDIEQILSGQNYDFNILSFRFLNRRLFKRLPLKCHLSDQVRDEVGFTIVDSIDKSGELGTVDCVLVCSFDEKRIIWSKLGKEISCLTFGESTGLTFDRVAIYISYQSKYVDERRWFTALTRARYSTLLINASGANLDDLAYAFEGRMLGHFMEGKADKDDLRLLLPGNPRFIEGFNGKKIGRDSGIKEDKCSGDPWLKSMLFLGQSEDAQAEEMEATEIQVEWFKTHIPLVELEAIRSRWVHKIMAKEYREVRMGCEVSNQFTDREVPIGGLQMTNSAERFETIYPRHSNADTVTFVMAVRKRLRFSSPNKEAAKLKAARDIGQMFCKEFLKRIPLNGRVDNDLMQKCVMDFEDKKVSKSAATIENHNGRSCRDWAADLALIFMKSQHCTKFDNRFREEAKAGQTLACFQHSVLVRFAPYMRYIEQKLLAALPGNYYIHSGKGLDELNTWVIRQQFSGECTESDYEAFDASQDHNIVAFEVAIMEYLQLPRDLIEDYVYIKCNLGSKLGDFAIMRFTGEASTFLFNTMANMLFTFLRYDLNGSESICFAGDDMCANRRLRVGRSFEQVLGKLKLKAKVQFTNKPTFCGWNLTSVGIFKKPQLVYERLQIARERDNLLNCFDSYAIEVSYAYKLGELASVIMDEEELECHHATVRFIVEHKYLLKSSVVNLFKRC